MIDRGLLGTMGLIVAAVAILDRLLRGRSTGKEPILGLASTPLLVGIAVGRLVAVALDDPDTLRRPFDLLLIRGGVEFWPGLAAAAAAVWVSAMREKRPPEQRLALLAPYALWAYGTYEAACLLRDGCFGPPMAAGLRPGGIGAPQLPVGVLVGLSAAALGAAVWRIPGLRPYRVVAVSVIGMAAIRVAAGFLLPKVTSGPTRAHWESMVVLAIALLGGAGLLARSAMRSGGDRSSRSAGGQQTSAPALEPHGPAIGLPADDPPG